MENRFDHIDRYFNGSMTPAEKAQFEKRRSVDKEFDKDVILYKQANEAVRAGARKRLKMHLDELGEQEFANTMVESYMRFRLVKKYWYAIAASILLIFGMGYFANQYFRAKAPTPTLVQLYNQYYEIPSTDLVITRGDNGDKTLSSYWNSAIQKYHDKQYRNAIRDFRGLLKNPEFTHSSAASFYLGISYLNINLPDSAIVNFRNVAPASSLYQDAGWYMGLGYLKAGNIPEAVQVFRNISGSPKHYKKKQAKEIIKHLTKFKHD